MSFSRCSGLATGVLPQFRPKSPPPEGKHSKTCTFWPQNADLAPKCLKNAISWFSAVFLKTGHRKSPEMDPKMVKKNSKCAIEGFTWLHIMVPGRYPDRYPFKPILAWNRPFLALIWAILAQFQGNLPSKRTLNRIRPRPKRGFNAEKLYKWPKIALKRPFSRLP